MTLPPKWLPSMATIQERRCLDTLLQGNRDGSDLCTGFCYDWRAQGCRQNPCRPSCEFSYPCQSSTIHVTLGKREQSTQREADSHDLRVCTAAMGVTNVLHLSAAGDRPSDFSAKGYTPEGLAWPLNLRFRLDFTFLNQRSWSPHQFLRFFMEFPACITNSQAFP